MRGLLFDELLSRGDTAAPLRTLATSEQLFGADTGRYWQMLADAGSFRLNWLRHFGKEFCRDQPIIMNNSSEIIKTDIQRRPEGDQNGAWERLREWIRGRVMAHPVYLGSGSQLQYRLKARLSGSACHFPTVARLSGSACIALFAGTVNPLVTD